MCVCVCVCVCYNQAVFVVSLSCHSFGWSFNPSVCKEGRKKTRKKGNLLAAYLILYRLAFLNVEYCIIV